MAKETITIGVEEFESKMTEMIEYFAPQIAKIIVDAFVVEGKALNASRDNDGAVFRIEIEVPDSEECSRFIDTQRENGNKGAQAPLQKFRDRIVWAA